MDRDLILLWSTCGQRQRGIQYINSNACRRRRCAAQCVIALPSFARIWRARRDKAREDQELTAELTDCLLYFRQERRLTAPQPTCKSQVEYGHLEYSIVIELIVSGIGERPKFTRPLFPSISCIFTGQASGRARSRQRAFSPVALPSSPGER